MTTQNQQPPWTHFAQGGVIYDLSHLHTYTTKFTRSADSDKPPESYSVNVSFSHHCFTTGLPAGGESYDARLRLDVDGDERIFNVRRWKLSKNLPGIIGRLHTLKCMQTRHSNYFTVALLDDDGATVEYDVFFRAWKPGKGRINLYVESAYVREARFGTSRPKGTRIGFFVILHNTLNKRQIHT
jgi:hypothetical protein